MKYKYILTLCWLFSVTLCCSANTADKNDAETVKMLMEHYLPEQSKNGGNARLIHRHGDFNGDGIKDIAVLFQPVSKPVESVQVKVSEPWVYPGSKPSNIYHLSIAIFNGNNASWKEGKGDVFVLLDSLGVLETPSFELRVSKKTDKDYANHSEMLPVKTSNDLIVLSTEAGIDTYIYWDKNVYSLLEPEEIP